MPMYVCMGVWVYTHTHTHPCSGHEGIWGRGGILPLILNLGTRWRWVFKFMPQLLYPSEKAPLIHWIGCWMGPSWSLYRLQDNTAYSTWGYVLSVTISASIRSDKTAMNSSKFLTICPFLLLQQELLKGWQLLSFCLGRYCCQLAGTCLYQQFYAVVEWPVPPDPENI
jgi:hypothetical protein